MTKKNVIVTVTDNQRIDGETEKYEITVLGKTHGTQQDFSIEYTEYDGEMKCCDTKINIKDYSSVSVIRSGAFNSEMIFENEKRHNCHYVTPYGAFMLGVYTRRVDFSSNDDGIILKLEYTIDYDTGLASENFMTITVKKQGAK